MHTVHKGHSSTISDACTYGRASLESSNICKAVPLEKGAQPEVVRHPAARRADLDERVAVHVRVAAGKDAVNKHVHKVWENISLKERIKEISVPSWTSDAASALSSSSARMMTRALPLYGPTSRNCGMSNTRSCLERDFSSLPRERSRGRSSGSRMRSKQGKV